MNHPTRLGGLNKLLTMSTYRQIFYQIIFGTKNREATISEAFETDLYKYIWGIIEGKKPFVMNIKGSCRRMELNLTKNIYCNVQPRKPGLP